MKKNSKVTIIKEASKIMLKPGDVVIDEGHGKFTVLEADEEPAMDKKDDKDDKEDGEDDSDMKEQEGDEEDEVEDKKEKEKE